MPTTRRSLFARRVTIATLAAGWLTLGSGQALEIRESVWGFNGQVVPDRFNLLSVLVINDAAAPFEGTLELYKSHGLGDRVGATYTEPIYLGGFGSRWVQFYPRVGQASQWILRWGRRPSESHSLDPPREGPPARVFLQDTADPQRPPAGLRVFADELFPVTVAATAGLGSVVLDHPPRWEPARRAAFLDWVQAGGIVQLLPTATGPYPVFADDLALLNSPLDRQPVGAGWVVRQPGARAAVSETVLSASGFPMPTFEDSEAVVMYDLDDAFFRALSPLTRARHAWGWLYTLTLVYLLAVGPGNYLLARRLGDYRLTIGAFLIGVTGFALLLNFVGRRGQDEASAVYTLSYARAVNGDQFDVTQWISLFVTKGDYYTIVHPAPHNLYALAQEHEPINALIDAGRGGQLLIDLPVFSRRGFLHQARMTGPDLDLQVSDWRETDGQLALSLTVGAGFPAETRGIWAWHKGNFYPLQRDADGRLTATAATPGFLELEKIQHIYQLQHQISNDEEPDAGPQMELLVPALVGYARGGVEGFRHRLSQPAATALPDHIEVFIFAASPPGLAIGHPQFGHEIGYTLYHVKLYQPVTGDPAL